eukprot:TRINITY_DN1279_c0_g1_i1.p3 TRINITY_DN1279_c0_g1~~TRINITY_DN1279_c0_g1_i1.p3  ORF type:complete len:63 (-),score=12.43 TRINITY_DN1279_c0_g1_i1:119-307(-)
MFTFKKKQHHHLRRENDPQVGEMPKNRLKLEKYSTKELKKRVEELTKKSLEMEKEIKSYEEK